MKLFEVMGVVGLDDAEAKKKLSGIDNQASDLSGKISKTGIAIGTAFGNIIAKGAMKLGEAIVNIGPSLVQSAASAEALGAQFEQVFGEGQKNAQALVDSLGKDFGMVPNRIKPAMTQMTSMFKGLGMDTEDAMTTAKDAVTMTADAAAFYDKSFEDANSALNSFIKGNYEGGESIGLFANETQLASWASKELGQDWKKLDEAGKQVARLEYAKAMQEAAGATGQAARESDSLENQMGNLRQVWDDLKAKFGAPILEPAVRGIQKLSEWLQSIDTSKFTVFVDWIKATASPIFSSFVDRVKQIKSSVEEWVGSSGPQLESIKQIFENVFARNVEVMTTLWNFLKDNLQPIFAGWFTWIQGHLPTIQATFTTVFGKVNQVANMVWAFFKNNILPILASFYSYIQSKMPQAQRIIESAFSIISNVVKIVWDIFENLLLPVLKALWDWVRPNIPKVQKTIETAFNAILSVVEGVVWVFDKVSGAVEKAIGWLNKWNNKEAKSKNVSVTQSGGGARAFATGTNFAPGGTALVGERGPEILELPRGSKVKTANQTKQLLGGDINQLTSAIMNLAKRPVSVSIDGREIVYATIDDIDDQLGSRARGQLYRMGIKG